MKKQILNIDDIYTGRSEEIMKYIPEDIETKEYTENNNPQTISYWNKKLFDIDLPKKFIIILAFSFNLL